MPGLWICVVRRAAVGVAAVGAIVIPSMVDAGFASASTPPTIATLTFTATGGSLDYPEGIATNNAGTVYVSNTNDNVVASVVGATDSTVAGSYEGNGENGDGGLAINATLASPSGLAQDSHGDLFVADTEDNTVRELLTNGSIVRFAGNGTPGDAGDGGLAVNAELDNPEGVAVNAAGDVFIADTYNNVIREVTTNGDITTFAGDGTAGYSGDNGPATAAELTEPTDVAVDSQGNVYIADAGNNVIRRVSTSNVITTVAGNFAADQASGGRGALSGDGGPATLARLNDPQGIALDQAGDLFIADTFNNAIREVSPAGIISTLVNTAGTKGNTDASTAAASTLSGPYAVTVDNSTGDVYIADTSNSAIKMASGLGIPGAAAAGPVAPSSAAESPTSQPIGLPIGTVAPLGTAGLFVGALGIRRRKIRNSAA